MPRWVVVTPEFERWHYDGIHPPEYGADVVEVECEGCDAQATVRRPAHLVHRLDGWDVICDDGHTSWEPEKLSLDSRPAA
jgi:hypothetical protein